MLLQGYIKTRTERTVFFYGSQTDSCPVSVAMSSIHVRLAPLEEDINFFFVKLSCYNLRIKDHTFILT